MRNRLLWIFVILLVVGIALAYGPTMLGLGPGIKPTTLHISVAAEPVACVFGKRASPETCASGFPLTNSLLVTLIADLLLVLTIIFGARNMQLVPRGFQNIVESIVGGFFNFAQSIDRKNIEKFFPFCASVFLFVLYANLFGLIPGVGSIGVCVPEAHAAATHGKDFFAGWPLTCEEGTVLVPYLRAPSADLNMTTAWALVSVFLIQFFGIQALGPSYLTKFFNIQGFRTSISQGLLDLFISVLELVSEFVRIVAFAFRLFGNIFAGEVVLVVMAFLLPYVLPLPFYGLELFVAFIQAVIFSVLSLVFMSLATQAHGGHDEHGHDAQVPIEAADALEPTGH
jgi:F-type H+-transporting ATPase subunit a